MVILPSPQNHSISFLSFSSRRKGSSKIEGAVLLGAIIFFLAFFLAGLNLMVQGKPLAGVATLTGFMITLWITVQVFTL